MKKKGIVWGIVALLVLGGIYYYLALPALNIHSVEVWYFLLYLGNLLIEIVRANVAVCHFVLSGTNEVEPIMVSFRTTLKSNLAKVILSNSITLTPGTITVSLHGDEVIVHCLDRSLAYGMEESSFVKMLEHMERIGETHGNHE